MAKLIPSVPDPVTELVQRLKAAEFQLAKIRQAKTATLTTHLDAQPSLYDGNTN